MAITATTTDRSADVFALLRELTRQQLTWSFEGTTQAESVIQRVAAAYGARADVTFLADAAVLTVGERTASFSRTPIVPPLDQVSDFKRLLVEIEGGGLSAREAATRLAALERRPPVFSKAWQVVGLGLFSLGFGISVQATGQEIVASAFLGLLVGVIVVAGQGRPRLALVSPFVASVTVSTLVLFAYKEGWIEGGPIQLMVPCLFIFIPGDAISAGVLELADGRITAGATRLIYSVAILLVLAFGALVATAIADVPESFLFDVEVDDTLGFWVAWGGWIVFAVGTMLTFSMRPGDFPWALGVLLLTAAAAQLGTRAFGEVIGTFLGAIVMTVAALLLGRPRNRPPGMLVAAAAVRSAQR